MEKPNMILVSVIIPTHNRSFLVTEAIESVLTQTYKNFELLVIDDGSTDNTPEMLSRFAGKLHCMRIQHRGPSAARNAGIRNAPGEFITFLDSDDLWLPDKLKQQVEFFTHNPSARICQTEEVWIRSGVRVNPQKKHKKYSGWIFEQCLPLCIVSPSAVMLHRSVFTQCGLFDETFPACEDYDLWLRIAVHYPIYLVSDPLVIKRGGHADQQSKKFPAMDRFRIKALCKLLESGMLNTAQYGRALQELKKKCQIYGNGCLKRGKRDAGTAVLQLPGVYESAIKTE